MANLCHATGQEKIVEMSQENTEINNLVDEIIQSVNIPTTEFLSEMPQRSLCVFLLI